MNLLFNIYAQRSNKNFKIAYISLIQNFKALYAIYLINYSIAITNLSYYAWLRKCNNYFLFKYAE